MPVLIAVTEKKTNTGTTLIFFPTDVDFNETGAQGIDGELSL